MSDNDNGCGAAVAEITASTELAKDFTLFQIEESLVLLAESAEEEGLTPEIERALTVTDRDILPGRVRLFSGHFLRLPVAYPLSPNAFGTVLAVKGSLRRAVGAPLTAAGRPTHPP